MLVAHPGGAAAATAWSVSLATSDPNPDTGLPSTLTAIGRILGPDGKPIVGSLRDNPQAHIPLSDWLQWNTWNTP